MSTTNIIHFQVGPIHANREQRRDEFSRLSMADKQQGAISDKLPLLLDLPPGNRHVRTICFRIINY